MSRQLYYRAATTELIGPHYGRRTGAAAYLPGSVHEVPLVNEDTTVSCGVGLYYTSHRRVAARWGPVVMTVRVLGKQVRSDAAVKPAGVPGSVDAGRYRKYRTDSMQILEIVGVVGYASWGGEAASYEAANANLKALNEALHRNSSDLRYRLTGRTLEKLRDERYRLWEVEGVGTLKTRHWRVKLAIDGYDTVGAAPVTTPDGLRDLVRETLGNELFSQGNRLQIRDIEVTEQEAGS